MNNKTNTAADSNTYPMNNTDLVALVWLNGDCWRWHLYVTYAHALTDSGVATTQAAALKAATLAAYAA